MAESKIHRTTVKSRLDNWNKEHADPLTHFELSGVDEYPEELLLDKARAKLLHKQSKKKEKIFIVEHQWQTESDFVKYAYHKWYGEEVFSDSWRSSRWGAKYTTLEGARNYLKTLRPDEKEWRNEVTGRNFRVRNTETGELFPYAHD